MAKIKPDEVATVGSRMYGVVKAAYREFGDNLVAEGIRPEVAGAFTQIFDNIEDYRKFWISNAGRPMFHAGGRYRIYTGGKVVALPDAQLFSEFMDYAIPLLDMRRIRTALRRKRWAQLGLGEAASKRRVKGTMFSFDQIRGWDDLGPGALTTLADLTVQKIWKPLVLLRVAWPVRVIAEEQVRMIAAGQDALFNHPFGWMAIASGRKLGTDLRGTPFADAAEFKAAMSRMGAEFGLGRPRNFLTSEYVSAFRGDPKWWHGNAVALQQLADDPITRIMAERIIEGQKQGTPITSVLNQVKDEFATQGTELNRYRMALAADSSRWAIIHARWASDEVIDHRFARMLQHTGGEFATTHHALRKWVDNMGDDLVFDQRTGLYTNRQGVAVKLPGVVPPPRPLHISQHADKFEQIADELAPLFSVGDAMFEDFASLSRFQLEDWDRWSEVTINALDEIRAVLPEGNYHRLMVKHNLADADPATGRLYLPELESDLLEFFEGMKNLSRTPTPDVTGEMISYAHQRISDLRGFLVDAKQHARKLGDSSGAASFNAMDVIEMAGSPEGVRLVRADYVPGPGMPTLDELAEKGGFTLSEIVNTFNTDLPLERGYKPYNVRHIGHDAAAEWLTDGKGTHIFARGGRNSGEEVIYISHDGMITGHITVRRDPGNGRVTDIIDFQTATPTERSVIWNDVADRAELTSSGILPGVVIEGADNDAERLLQYAMNPRPAEPGMYHWVDDVLVEPLDEIDIAPLKLEDMAEVMMVGTSIREWLDSAGRLMVDADNKPLLTLGELAEFMRHQYGAAWSSADGPLGRIPDIHLGHREAAAWGRAVLDAGLMDSDSMKAMRASGIMGEDLSNTALAWRQSHPYTVQLSEFDPELMEAIATGRLRGKKLSFADALDEPEQITRISDIAEELRHGWEGREQMFPDVVKYAREADSKRLDGVVDHMFDLLASRPTNFLSRAPAFRQFYWRRVAEFYPYANAATQRKIIAAARKAGIGNDLGSMVKAAWRGSDVAEEGLEKLAKDYTAGRFAGVATGDFTNFDELDEVAKVFALHETKRLLYDLTKKTQFFDMTRNLFPFGEAWYEIITTWARLFNENPRLFRRLQQGLEGARRNGYFYPDPANPDEEVFGMPHIDFLTKAASFTPWFDEPAQGDEKATPVYTGRVSGVNLALNNFLPGVGPMLQMPLASFAQDMMDDPDMRWFRDLVFPYGYPDAQDPGSIVNSVMPAWFRKAMVAISKPIGDDERLYNNTIIDVIRAMELNGEIDRNVTPAQWAEIEETARKRARTIYLVRSLQQFIGPTGANVRWDVEVDPEGEAFTYQVLATEYRKLLETNAGDRVQATMDFINQFGFDPTSIVTAKTEQVLPRTVTEPGLDFERNNQDTFAAYPMTAYYLAPDIADADFSYAAYLEQLRKKTRVPLTPEQWRREGNIVAASIQYERVKRRMGQLGVNRDPAIVAYMRAFRYNLMAEYPGYGFENYGVVAQAENEAFQAEFNTWRTDERMASSPAGQGLIRYLDARDHAISMATTNLGLSREGFATAKSARYLRAYLYGVGRSLSSRYPDFATIFQRHYLWEVEDPDPVIDTSALGIDLTPTGGS